MVERKWLIYWVLIGMLIGELVQCVTPDKNGRKMCVIDRRTNR